MNICIATNDNWVKESLEKNLIGDYVLHVLSSEITKLSEDLINLDYFFVDMQFSNAGGPSTIKTLKTLIAKEISKPSDWRNIREPRFILIADRETDVFQGKRVGVNEVVIKPLTKSKIKKILTK